MRYVYVSLRNMLLFFFIAAMFSGLKVRDGNFIDKAMIGLLFGVVMAFVPQILKFFKLPVNAGSLIMMGLVACFAFYFVSIYFLELLNVTKSTFDLGISFVSPIELKDRTMALVFLSFISAIISVGLELLSKSK